MTLGDITSMYTCCVFIMIYNCYISYIITCAWLQSNEQYHSFRTIILKCQIRDNHGKYNLIDKSIDVRSNFDKTGFATKLPSKQNYKI